MKVKEVKVDFERNLSAIYSKEELNEIVSLAFEFVLGFSKTNMTTRSDEKLDTKEAYDLGKILYDLKQNKPIQYILGYSWFYGMKMTVNEDVLIPRPETEELVRWIIETCRTHGHLLPTILDIGTGSGCVAIALKKNIPQANMFALDISEKAIDVAKSNAEQFKAEIKFIHSDILSNPSNLLHTKLNTIVSNPPYVLHSEKSSLQERVMKFEPHIALFADENDALIYYRAIADFALQYLAADGMLFLEIHEKKGDDVEELLLSKGFTNVEVRQDMSGKDRMIKATIKQ